MGKSQSKKRGWWLILAVLVSLVALAFAQMLWDKQASIETALLSGQRVELSLEGEKTTARVRDEKQNKADVSSQAPVPLNLEILLVGLGENPELMQEALTLPQEITFGMKAHTPTLEYWVDQIKLQERQFYIEVPLHLTHENTVVGAYDVLSIATPSQQVDKVKELFARAEGRKGAYIILNPEFASYREAYHSLFTFLSAKNIPVAYASYKEEEHPLFYDYRFNAADIYVTQSMSPSIMYHRLREAVGSNIKPNKTKRLILDANKESLKALKHWLDDIKALKHVTLKPLSYSYEGGAS